eukprot:532313_1
MIPYQPNQDRKEAGVDPPKGGADEPKKAGAEAPKGGGGGLAARHSPFSNLSVERMEGPGMVRGIFNWTGELTLVQSTVIGVAFATVFALCVRHGEIKSGDLVKLLRFPGNMFVNALKLLVTPFIAVSMLMVPSNLGDVTKSKKIGKNAMILFLSTTTISVFNGLLWYYIIDPGSTSALAPDCPAAKFRGVAAEHHQKGMLDVFLNIGLVTALPKNLFQALASG